MLDFSIKEAIELVEERVGKRLTGALVYIVLVTLVVFCLAFLYGRLSPAVSSLARYIEALVSSSRPAQLPELDWLSLGIALALVLLPVGWVAYQLRLVRSKLRVTTNIVDVLDSYVEEHIDPRMIGILGRLKHLEANGASLTSTRDAISECERNLVGN